MSKIDTKKFDSRMNKLDDLANDMMHELYPEVKRNTPIRSGNARNKTRFNSSKNQIKSGYPYAGRLNEGWSRQAPEGFTKPSIKKLPGIIRKILRKI